MLGYLSTNYPYNGADIIEKHAKKISCLKLQKSSEKVIYQFIYLVEAWLLLIIMMIK